MVRFGGLFCYSLEKGLKRAETDKRMIILERVPPRIIGLIPNTTTMSRKRESMTPKYQYTTSVW
jgi:hypothetical protein